MITIIIMVMADRKAQAAHGLSLSLLKLDLHFKEINAKQAILHPTGTKAIFSAVGSFLVKT